MNSKKLPFHLLPLALPATATFLGQAQAADVTAITNNGDWIAEATWSDNAVPAAGNAYFVPNAIAIDGYVTAGNNNTTPITRTFGGGSLTIQSGGSLYLDSSHNTSYPDWNYTISNLTLQNGSNLHVRGGSGTDFFLTNGFTVAADSTVAIRHSGGSFDQRFRLGAVSGPSTATIQILGTHNPSSGGVNAKDNYATVANSSYAGNWFLDTTVAAAGKNVRLRADAANALGTGSVTLSRQAILENNAAGGLNSLTGITLEQPSSTANLGTGWTSPTGTLALSDGNLLLGSGFSTSSFASLSHANGIIQFDLGSSPANADKIVVSGNYDVTGLGPIDLYLKADPGSSTFDLITYGGTLTGTPDILVAPSSPTRLVPTISAGDGSNDKVSVSFAGATANLLWKGNDLTNPNNWDLNVTSNFDNGGSPDKFLTIDSVTFDDTAASFTPTLVGTLVPKGVTFNNTSDYALGGTGVIAGNGTLVKNGSGTLTITPASTFNGGTTLNAGKIRIGNNAALGTGPLTVTNGAITSDSATARSLAVPLVLNGSLTVGDTTDLGTVTFSNGATLTGNSSITVPGAPIANALNGVITDGAGTFSLAKLGTGNINFNSANTYDGGTLISAGRISSSNVGALGSGPVTVEAGGQAYFSSAGTIANSFTLAGSGITETSGALGSIRLGAANNLGGSITLAANARITAYNSTGTISGSISDAGGARKLELGGSGLGASGGTLTVSGSNSHSGGTDVRGAIVVAQNNNAFGTGDVLVDEGAAASYVTRADLQGVTVPNNFILDSSAQTAFFGPLTASGGTLSTVNGTVTISSSVGNGGHLASNGAGSVLRVNGELLILNGVIPNVRQGSVILAGGGSYPRLDQGQGDLKIGADNGISPVAQLRLAVSATGTFDLNGFNQTLSQLNRAASFAATVTNTAAAPSVLTLDGIVDHSFSGTLTEGAGSGGLSLVKKGSSILTLAAASTYTGTTTIDGGTLRINAAHGVAGFSPVNVSAAGTLGGIGPVNGDIAVAGTVAPGNSAGLLFTNDSVTFGPGSKYAWEIDNWTGTVAGTAWDLIDALDLVITATPSNKLTIVVSGTAANFTESAKTVEIARSSNPVTGFNPAAIQIDDSAFIGSGTWAVQVNGNSIELVYTAGSGTPFSTWAIANGIAGADPDLDADNDGIPNGIEFVLGGDPSGPGADSNSLLPVITTDATYLNFTYRRTDASQGMPEAQRPYVQYSTTLGTWTEAEAGVNGVLISEVNGTPDLVTVRIPRSLGGTELFARLRADID